MRRSPLHNSPKGHYRIASARRGNLRGRYRLFIGARRTHKRKSAHVSAMSDKGIDSPLHKLLHQKGIKAARDKRDPQPLCIQIPANFLHCILSLHSPNEKS